VLVTADRCGKGDGLCHGSGGWQIAARPSGPSTGGIRKRDPRFPRPCGTAPRRPAGSGTTQASARPGGREAPAGGGPGAGRGLWPPAGQGSVWRCRRGDGPCHCSGASAFAPPGGNRKRDPRFPRPRATVPCRPAGPGTAEGQRPNRLAGSARRWRVGRPPGAGQARCRAWAMAPARPHGALADAFPAFRSGTHATGTFADPCHCRLRVLPPKRQAHRPGTCRMRTGRAIALQSNRANGDARRGAFPAPRQNHHKQHRRQLPCSASGSAFSA